MDAVAKRETQRSLPGIELRPSGPFIAFILNLTNEDKFVAQTGSGAHPASYPLGTRGSFPGGKATAA
jgi:hypothetical protein